MRILIADDHDLVRYGLRKLLASLETGAVVSEARTFEEALKIAETHNDLGLVILDLNMPGMHGFQGLETMRQRFPDIPAVILSASLDRDDVFNAMSRGAHGFIPKILNGTSILNALRLILSGERYIPSMVLDTGGDMSMPLKPSNDHHPGFSGHLDDEAFSQLTSREREVLDLLTQGLSNKEIARRLGVQEVTIKAHLKRLFRKLGVSNRTQAVKLAIQLGWAS